MTRKITVHKETGMVMCRVLPLPYIHLLLLCYREWTCSRVQDRCEAPRLSNLRNFSYLNICFWIAIESALYNSPLLNCTSAPRLQFFFVKVRRQSCGGGPKVTLKSSVPDLIQICSDLEVLCSRPDTDL